MSDSNELRREQVRAVFAIGMIASIYTVQQHITPRSPLAQWSWIVELGVNILVLPWVGYILCMAIGVSGDIFSNAASRIFAFIGHALFMFGVLYAAMGVFLTVIILGFFSSGPVSATVVFAVIVFFSVLSTGMTVRLLRKRFRKSQNAPQIT